MALISHIVKELAASTGTAEKSITVIARWLREDGLLSQKGHGRGAAQATPLDAARLLIALMIGGKSKNAPQAVRDFGQLVISPPYLDEENRTSIERHFGLPSCRTFEEGLAVLIDVWGNGDAMRAMRKYFDRAMRTPRVLATLHDHSPSGSIQIENVNAGYSHPHKPRGVKLLDAERPNDGVASWEKLNARYHSGIENRSLVTNELLRPLGEVVADLREPGSMQLPDELIPQPKGGGGDAGGNQGHAK